MRPIFIIVEGQTEQDFFRECLCPYWREQHGINEVYVRLLGPPGGKGGNVSAARICHDAERLLKQRSDAIVSTFVDYYGIRTSLPNYSHCQTLSTADQRIACLEEGLTVLVNSLRFVPYIQKHEFEALLFSRDQADNTYITKKLREAIQQMSVGFADSEEIDSDFPPSKRLITLFSEHERVSYDKRTFGSVLALEIGMPSILKNCPRFASWVENLAQRATTA